MSYGYYKGNTTLEAIKEAYRTIRTNLMFSIVKEGCKTLVFTSSVQSEGKTTSAVNTAVALAESEKKVLLCDLDLRRPKVHKLIKKIKNVPGLTNYLGGFNSLEDVLHKEVFKNLDVITAGTITPNPAEIISSSITKKLFEELKNNYDYIIIDTPPVNVVSDALSVIPYSDGVVFITRFKYTHHDDIKNAVEQIEFVGGKVIGVIVNGTDDFKKGGKYGRYGKYGKYGKYSYRYGYGYGYSNKEGNSEDGK